MLDPNISPRHELAVTLAAAKNALDQLLMAEGDSMIAIATALALVERAQKQCDELS